jgi:hypothetical protein
MHTLWRILVRTIFWSYDRGTWPYDLAVVGIVLFVLLTPRGWYHDQPQVGPALTPAEVQLYSEDAATGIKTYRVDARLIASPVHTPQFDKDIHDLLRKNVPELRGRRFEVKQYEAVRVGDGRIVSYDVSIKP